MWQWQNLTRRRERLPGASAHPSGRALPPPVSLPRRPAAGRSVLRVGSGHGSCSPALTVSSRQVDRPEHPSRAPAQVTLSCTVRPPADVSLQQLPSTVQTDLAGSPRLSGPVSRLFLSLKQTVWV